MKTKTFPHGIHPQELKETTSNKSLQPLPAPEKVIIPLHQHFGSPAEPLVKKGDEVFMGQKIGESNSFFSACVHSSVSGKVMKIENYNHPLGNPVPAVTISNDGKDRVFPDIKEQKDPLSLNPEKIRQIIKDAGIVGLGGAAFPTAVKLSPPKDKPIDTIIINGCECEPVLTADHRLMLEYPDDIIKGAELVRIATGAKKIILGIENNKQDVYNLLQKKIYTFPLEISLLKTKYPQGAEKNLISALLKRAVPRGGLPFDVGVVVQNVGTVKAIWDAVAEGKPLYERALTVSGAGITSPKNLIVRIGSLFQNAIDYCGGLQDSANILVMGGPMMGLAQGTSDVPVIKGTSGILAWAEPEHITEHNCISCGRCVTHCPMGLVPTQLMKYSKLDYLSEAESRGIMDCVECGSCQYSCPAGIPLVHWLRVGKHKITDLKRKKSA
jgi:electron transport complex protein RnfC